MTNLLDLSHLIDLDDLGFPDVVGCNYYRQDHWSATAYLYLDSPENDLPELQPVEEWAAGLVEVEGR